MIIAMVIEEVLKEVGFDVVHAGTGLEALTELEQHAADFRVVLTDIKLPGANGWEVARRARELNPEVGLVCVSGDSAAEFEANGVPGATFLQKPYSNGDLVMAIMKAAY